MRTTAGAHPRALHQAHRLSFHNLMKTFGPYRFVALMSLANFLVEMSTVARAEERASRRVLREKSEPRETQTRDARSRRRTG
jgi:hypothetical protein